MIENIVALVIGLPLFFIVFRLALRYLEANLINKIVEESYGGE